MNEGTLEPESHQAVETDICTLTENGSGENENQIKELKTTFDLELADLPNIADFIERLKTIIRRQQKKLNKIYAKLKDHRLRPIVSCEEVAVQTEAQDEEPCEPVEEASPLTPNGEPSSAWGAGEDLADEVKKVAEQALTRSGFVYEPTSGMYYDYKTGYYYNADLRMYYDGNSGKYLSYDENTKEYSYHDPPADESASSKDSKAEEDKGKKRKRSEEERDAMEEGEISESSSEEEQVEQVEAAPPSPGPEVAAAWPPCLRLMVTASSAPGVGIGRLFLVTCSGGDVGREGNAHILLPETLVSKVHLRISYKDDKYQLVDVGSRNGTWHNGKRLAAALQESSPRDVAHGDELRIGSTTLAVHIHSGQDTCSGCEPGLQQKTVEIPAPLPATMSHRTGMRSLKKRFGLGKTVPLAGTAKNSSYTDRAEKRRTAVGSSHPAEKTEAACLTQSIPTENKGFKMLSKMGWSAGKSLGKSEQGIAEPVALVSHVGSAGLGAALESIPPETNAGKRKLRVMKVTHNRYNQPPQLPKDSSSDEDTEKPDK